MLRLATKNKTAKLKYFTDGIVIKRHRIIVEEADVIRALYAINRQHTFTPDMRVSNCGWADDANKWAIYFTTTEAKWNAIRCELRIIRVFNDGEIPKNSVGSVYSTD